MENHVAGRAQSRKSRVLLVDDEPIIHTVFTDLLEDDGYEVKCVVTAEQALEELKTDTYDLAIVDKNLPGMTGISMMHVLRMVQVDIAFIMITGFSTYESGVDALRLGAVAYLKKPFRDLATIRDTIAGALERHRLVRSNVELAERVGQAHRELSKATAALDESVNQRTIAEMRNQNAELKRAAKETLSLLRDARHGLEQLVLNRADAEDYRTNAELVGELRTSLIGEIEKLEALGQ